ncbi:PAS domain-containing sensor histidine kinase [Nocardioides coralli]|uniref:PAS domain-containing sensor histidine kinase n=1 Tax=Nocardioides coralli TaxID=2872154 RepID=UPI001CA3D536|nr:ATP-binding protein [Nocardioides coralli]QZY30206.1 PAS domain-containing protein [Nocardioides coralli]
MPPPAAPPSDVYRDMLDVAPDAMVAVDATTGEIRLANAHAAGLFGRDADELVGSSLRDVLPGCCPTRAEAAVELRVLRPDGGEVPVQVWCSPLPGCEGLLGITVRDAADRPSVHEVSERVRDELLATISHELRTPLTSILGYTELLVEMGDERLGAHATRLLDAVRRNARRELRLVEDMLVLAQLGSSTLEIDPQPLDLGQLARSVCADHAVAATRHGVVLDTSGLAPVWVLGDADRLVQVLANLVGNAVKFTPPGGRVEVRLRGDDGHALLEVEDQGVGVAPEEVPRVFDRLHRAPDVVKAHVPGAGLGLPVAKGIVEALHGDIAVDSSPGLGTTVQVRLPLVSAEMAV